jgi:site-specific DNA recombinase
MGKQNTPAAKRAASYVRVSSEEQVEGYSLPAQERAIAAYCALHEYELVARYRDEGKSARSDDLGKRPAFRQMLSEAEA